MFVSSSISRELAFKPNRGEAVGEAFGRPLTVLQLVPRMDQGGVERGTAEIAEAIVRAGGRALVATSGGQMLHRIAKAGAEIVAMNIDAKNPLSIWHNSILLARLIRDLGIDILHARSRAPAWSGYLACRRTGARFITTYHGIYGEGFPLKRRYNAVMARGQPVIAPSEFVRELIIGTHRVRPENIVVIPRGVDLALFSDDAVGSERTVKLARAWGLLDDPRPVIMLPGRVTRWKGAEDLVEAAAKLRQMRGDDFLVLLVGAPESEGFARSLARRIARMGLGDCVRLAGATSDMPAALKLASVVVAPSRRPEAFGRVVVEAQAMGRPVIAAAHGGVMETVAHGETGWLVPPGDIARLAEALHRALELDPSARAQMGMTARARVHARFSLGAMQRATLAIYEEATGRVFGSAL